MEETRGMVKNPFANAEFGNPLVKNPFANAEFGNLLVKNLP